MLTLYCELRVVAHPRRVQYPSFISDPWARDRTALNLSKSYMDRFVDLQTLVAVGQTGSISQAAARISTTKSVVSQRLTLLERRLNVQLIVRQSRGVSLTEAGQRLYDRAVSVLAELASAEEEACATRGSPMGRIRVTAPLSFGRQFLTGPFVKFAAAHPRIMLDVDFDDHLVNLSAGGYDLAVRASLGPLADSSLVARTLAPMRHVLCASPEYLSRVGVPRAPGDLQNHDAVLYSNVDPNPTWQLSFKGGPPTSFRVRARMRCNSGELLVEFARQGLGIASVPLFLVAPVIAQRELVIVLTDWAPPAGSISVVYPTTRQLPTAVRLLVDHLAADFASNAAFALGER
jgi:DNA-binding transcriptional LysR family regulator